MAFPNDPTSPPVLELNSHAINTSCVGFWPLTHVQGTTATDISTGGNDGTESGGVAWASTDLGNAASFDGVDDKIVSSATSTSPATWSAWVYNDHAPSVAAFIVSGNSVSARNDIWAASSFYRMWAGTTYLDGVSIPKVGEWQHVVGVFDGASSKLYVDGVLEATGNPGSQVLSSGITIGWSAANNAYGFDGFIQNVRLFNTALSASDVALLYSRPWVGTDYDELWPYSPPVPSSMSLSTDAAATSLNSGCVGWWPLTEGTGTVAKDIVGTNDGTLGSGVTWEDGETGKTAVFDGTANAEISLTTQPVSGQSISISAWIKVASSVTGIRSIYCERNSINNTQNYLWYNGGLKTFTFDHYLPSGTPNITSSDPGIDGRWINVVATQDATTTKIYYDGQLQFTGTAEVYGSSAPTTFQIGSRNGTDSFDGNIQNLRIWDRVLTADEVALLNERPWEGEATYGDALYNDPPPTLTLGTTAEDVAINTDCVGWWPLLETDDYASGAADISGNGNNGTQSGGVLSAYSPLGGVASLDGTDDYISATHDATLSFDVAAGATFSAWVNPDTVAGGATFSTTNPRYILAKSPANVASSNYLLRLLGGTIDFTYRNSGNTSYVTQLSDSEVVSAGSFQHIVAVHTGTSIVLYLNGSPVASTLTSGTATDSSQTNTSDFIIGKEGLGTQRYFGGDIQNVRVWSRALSAVEVQSLYETPWIGSNYGAVAAFYNFIFRSKRFRRL